MATLMEKDVLIEKIANLINDLMLHHKEAIEDIAWLIASREWLLFSSHTSIAFHAWIVKSRSSWGIRELPKIGSLQDRRLGDFRGKKI